jgi:hypothetical protein
VVSLSQFSFSFIKFIYWKRSVAITPSLLQISLGTEINMGNENDMKSSTTGSLDSLLSGSCDDLTCLSRSSVVALLSTDSISCRSDPLASLIRHSITLYRLTQLWRFSSFSPFLVWVPVRPGLRCPERLTEATCLSNKSGKVFAAEHLGLVLVSCAALLGLPWLHWHRNQISSRAGPDMSCYRLKSSFSLNNPTIVAAKVCYFPSPAWHTSEKQWRVVLLVLQNIGMNTFTTNMWIFT